MLSDPVVSHQFPNATKLPPTKKNPALNFFPNFQQQKRTEMSREFK
jgi:hypothetical protein